jgi:hypothetical protein
MINYILIECIFIYHYITTKDQKEAMMQIAQPLSITANPLQHCQQHPPLRGVIMNYTYSDTDHPG